MLGSRNWRAMRDTRRYRHHYPVGSCRWRPPTSAAHPGQSPPPGEGRQPLLSDQVPCPARDGCSLPSSQGDRHSGVSLSALAFKTRDQHQLVGTATRGPAHWGPCWGHSCRPHPCPLHPEFQATPGLPRGGQMTGTWPTLARRGRWWSEGAAVLTCRVRGPCRVRGVLASPQRVRGLWAPEQTPPPPGTF